MTTRFPKKINVQFAVRNGLIVQPALVQVFAGTISASHALQIHLRAFVGFVVNRLRVFSIQLSYISLVEKTFIETLCILIISKTSRIQEDPLGKTHGTEVSVPVQSCC